MSEMSNQPEQEFSAQQWVEQVHASRTIDEGLAADSFDPLESQMKSVVEGRTIDEQLQHEHSTDFGVIHKNILLSRLADLADDPDLHVGDFLSLLDRQASELEQPSETRHRQFMGLWDILVAISKDEELIEFLKRRPGNY